MWGAMGVLDVAGRIGTTALSSLWLSAAMCSPGSGHRFDVKPLPASVFEELRLHGYAVIPEWLPRADVERVRHDALALEAAGLAHPAKVGTNTFKERTRRLDQQTRSSQSVTLQPPMLTSAGNLSTRLALTKVIERLREELATYLHLPLEAAATELGYLYYPVGGFYTRHVDVRQQAPMDRQRRWRARLARRTLSLLLYLDAAWQADFGGALRVYLDEPSSISAAADGLRSLDASRKTETGAEGSVDIMPVGGTLVLMDSVRMDHAVLQTRKRRHCVVGWFRSAAPPLLSAATSATTGTSISIPAAGAEARRAGRASTLHMKALGAPTGLGTGDGENDVHGLPLRWKTSVHGSPRTVWRANSAEYLARPERHSPWSSSPKPLTSSAACPTSLKRGLG